MSLETIFPILKKNMEIIIPLNQLVQQIIFK